MEYWLIAYAIDGSDIVNDVTTEDPFDFIIRMNEIRMELNHKYISMVNFWSITKEKYDKLCEVI